MPDIKVVAIEPARGATGLAAHASVSIDSLGIVLRNLRIMRRSDGYAVYMPARRDDGGHYIPHIEFYDRTLLSNIERYVLDEFNKWRREHLIAA